MHDGTTPLMLAVRLAVEGMVEELINADADVNASDAQGNIIRQSYCRYTFTVLPFTFYIRVGSLSRMLLFCLLNTSSQNLLF